MITANEMIRMLQEAIEKSGDKNMPVFVRPSEQTFKQRRMAASELSAEIKVGHCDNEWDDVTPTVPCIVFDAEDLNDTITVEE